MEKRGKMMKVSGNSLGASGFTLGIISILSLGISGVIMSMLGFAFCVIQQKSKKTKLGKAGVILNVIGFILSLVFIFWLAPMLTQWMQTNGLAA